MTKDPRSREFAARRLLSFEATTMDRLQTAIIATDLEGRLLYANPFAREVYGWSADEMTGELVGDALGIVVDPLRVTEILHALKAGKTWEGEFELARPDGSTLTVHSADSGLYAEDGQLVGVVSIVNDRTEHRESVEQLTAETVALRFLLDATTALSSSLDYRECLRQLATIAVPALGDLCLLDMVVEGAIDRLAWAIVDPDKVEFAAELSDFYRPDPAGQHPAAVAIRTGQSSLVAELTNEALRAMTTLDRHYELFLALGYRSYICVPLIARGRVLGNLMLVSFERSFVSADLTLAEELAARAALVMDNVRLLSERTRVARALQAALLPPTLPALPGLELAARYRAAGEGIEVGGDLYDVFSAGGGAWAAVVGDVSGTGPEAAALTGLVRHAFHAAALQDPADPATMLETADALIRERQGDQERFCSACCTIIRPGNPVRVVVASAGHPPPIVLHRDGSMDELAAQSALLGIGDDQPRAIAERSLAPGDRLLLYTDGLIEARDADGEFFGEVALVPTLEACSDGGADELAQCLLDAVEGFSGGRIADDLALLVIAVPR